MLLPYTTITYYGPGAGAANAGNGVGSVAAGLSGLARQTASLSGLGVISAAHVTGLKHSPALLAGSGTITGAAPRASARLLCAIQIGSRPSADDVAWAVLDTSLVESGLTVRQALRLMTAVLAGTISGADGSTITIRNAVANDTDRIVATVDGAGNRTAITVELQ